MVLTTSWVPTDVLKVNLVSEFLSPDFVLNKFYPKYNYLKLDKVQNIKFDPKKELTKYAPM